MPRLVQKYGGEQIRNLIAYQLNVKWGLGVIEPFQHIHCIVKHPKYGSSSSDITGSPICVLVYVTEGKYKISKCS